MNYSELIQAYFERSVALQWYWTLYVLVIGGLVGFSTFRQRPELVTTILITTLFACFAFKNEGAIEATAEEREAIRAAFRQYPASGSKAADIQLTRDKLEPTLTEYDIPGVRYFHIACAVLTVIFIWAKEWRRRTAEQEKEKANA
jgi:hypothetical protein